MKKHIVAILACLLLTIPFATLPTQTAAAVSTPLPPALTGTSSVNEPIDMTVYVPCALGGHGEYVSLSGNMHVESHSITDPNGRFHYESVAVQRMSGVGATSGDKYQGTGVTRDSGYVEGIPSSVSYVNNFLIIGQGPGNNFVLHENVHLTINANGEITADVDNFSADCK